MELPQYDADFWEGSGAEGVPFVGLHRSSR